MEAALNGPSGRTTLGPAVFSIGRTPGNQLVVNDVKASSRHAEIRPEGQGYSIIDLGSTNGTFVNDERLEPNVAHFLIQGDRLRIGDTLFTYEVIGTPQLDPTVYAAPGQGMEPGFLPTVAVPPPSFPGYASNQQGGPYIQPPPPAYQPPPPPSYQAYPAPAQQQYIASVAPIYAPPASVQKKSRRGLWITLSVIIGVLLVSCIAISVFVANLSTPQKTLTTFCDSLKSGDYQTAYNQLSSTLQSQFAEGTFAAAFSSNNGAGKVTACTVSNITNNGSTGTGTIDYIFANNSTARDNYGLVDESGTWKINNQNLGS